MSSLQSIVYEVWPTLAAENELNPPQIFDRYHTAVQSLLGAPLEPQLLTNSKDLFASEEQRQARLESRATTCLTAAGLASTFLVGLTPFVFADANSARLLLPFPIAKLLLFVATLAYFLRSVIFALRVHGKVVRYVLGPDDVVPNSGGLESVPSSYQANISRQLLTYTIENYKINNRQSEVLSVSQLSLRNAIVCIAAAGILLVVEQSVSPSVQPVPKQGSSVRETGIQSSPALPARPGVSTSWPFFGVAALAVVTGTFMVLRGQHGMIKAVGAGTIAAGLLTNGHLVNKIELRELLKIEKPDIVFEIGRYVKSLGGIGPEHLLQLVDFDSGRANVKETMRSGISDVCARWQEHTGKGQQGLLLVVGATDRVPLSSEIRLQYESNFGLARARAERVKSKIVECGVQSPRVLTLVAGPRNTPEVLIRSQTSSGFAEDRSVDVWALWSWPELIK